jgi:hypothetical protein
MLLASLCDNLGHVVGSFLMRAECRTRLYGEERIPSVVLILEIIALLGEVVMCVPIGPLV